MRLAFCATLHLAVAYRAKGPTNRAVQKENQLRRNDLRLGTPFARSACVAGRRAALSIAAWQAE